MESDKKLINKYLKGNQEAFEMLYGRYKNKLYSYLNNLVPGQPHLADDFYQQTWIKAIDNLHKYKHTAPFFAWLSRIAHNLFVDYCRKNKTVQNNEILNNYSSIKTPSKEFERKELETAFAASLERVEPVQREVFLLRQNGVSFKEIAKIQDTGINTVLGRMRYALEKLRELMIEHL